MQFVRIDFWPAGLVLASAALLILAMRLLERFAHSATVRHTRRSLQHALDNPTTEALRSGADTGVG